MLRRGRRLDGRFGGRLHRDDLIGGLARTSIETVVHPFAPLVEPITDAIALLVEALGHSVAPSVESLRPTRRLVLEVFCTLFLTEGARAFGTALAAIFDALGLVVEPLIDAFATPIESTVDTITAPVESPLDAVALAVESAFARRVRRVFGTRFRRGGRSGRVVRGCGGRG